MSRAERRHGEQGETELMEDFLIPEYMLKGEKAPANADDLPIPRCHSYFNARLGNSRYASLACTQGWFCASCRHPRSKNINTLANIFIAKYDGEWHKLDLSPSIRSIIMLNLPSFSGGFNPWGAPSTSKAQERALTAPYVNDGLIEIVGFRYRWHGMSLILPPHHGTRLAQAHKVKVEFHKGGVDHTYMRVDEEPWLQNLPPDDKPTVMEITHKGQAVALAYGKCIKANSKGSCSGGKATHFNGIVQFSTGNREFTEQYETEQFETGQNRGTGRETLCTGGNSCQWKQLMWCRLSVPHLKRISFCNSWVLDDSGVSCNIVPSLVFFHYLSFPSVTKALGGTVSL